MNSAGFLWLEDWLFDDWIGITKDWWVFEVVGQVETPPPPAAPQSLLKAQLAAMGIK